jgi:beta-N-acetylhexosaminidase
VAIGFDGPRPDAEVRDLIRRGVRSVILFARNAGPRAQVAETIERIKGMADDPVLVCVDQEGGDTVRFTDGFDPPPFMREVGKGGASLAGVVGRRLASDLRPVGIDLDLAPVVDVDSNPRNPVIGPRSFGSTPELVAECGAALIVAMQAGGLAACAKHFPGHGDTDLDSHHDLPVLRNDLDRLRAIDLPPFKAAIEAGVAAIMTTHVVFESLDPGVPATMSAAAVDGLLRGELGFDGVVISDDLEMAAIADLPAIAGDLGEAAVRSVLAGVDLVLCCHREDRQHRVIDALAEAIASGRISAERVQASHRRLDRLVDRFVRSVG